MSDTKRTVGRVLLAAAIAAVPAAGAAHEADAVAGLDAMVERGLKDWQVPGLAVAVVKDGKVLLAKGYGVRSLSGREPVTADTSFFIASASKSFTATLAAMLVEEGKANWDRPIAADVPSFRLQDAWATSRVSLRDMLSHRTGIPRQEFLKVHPPERRTDLVDAIRYFEPAQEFRSGFRYSNEVVTVAGDLLAQQAGTTWEDLVRRRILGPLGMSRTSVTTEEMRTRGDYATPYIVRQEHPEEMALYDVSRLRGPAGAIVSTARDMSRWLLFNLGGGTIDGQSVLRTAALSALFVPQVPATARAPREAELTHQSYGLGWFIDAYRGFPRISHPGNLYGFSAMVSFLPRQNVGVVVLANLNGTPLPDIVERFVYDTVLGLSVTDWSGRMQEEDARARAAYEREAKPAAPAPPLPSVPPSHPLDEYSGRYACPGYGTVVIGRTGDRLTITVGTGTFPLEGASHDAFRFDHPVEGQAWRLVFREGFGGEVQSFALDAGGGLQPLVFSRLRANKVP